MRISSVLTGGFCSTAILVPAFLARLLPEGGQ